MTHYSAFYQNCQHLNTIIRAHHYHAAGEFCADCGKWLRWVSKKEYKLYSENHHNSETENNLNNQEVA